MDIFKDLFAVMLTVASIAGITWLIDQLLDVIKNDKIDDVLFIGIISTLGISALVMLYIEIISNLYT